MKRENKLKIIFDYIQDGISRKEIEEFFLSDFAKVETFNRQNYEVWLNYLKSFTDNIRIVCKQIEVDTAKKNPGLDGIYTFQKPIQTEDKLYTIEEVAGRIKVTKQTVYSWIKKGKFKPLIIGNSYRVNEEQIQELLRGK